MHLLVLFGGAFSYMIGKEISLLLHYSVCGDGTFEIFCIEDNPRRIVGSTAIRGCNQEVLYDSRHCQSFERSGGGEDDQRQHLSHHI